MRVWVVAVGLVLGVGCTGVDRPGGDVADVDRDGFGASIDCDDLDPAVHPGANEICDGLDNDCNGVLDDSYAVDARVFFIDNDFDGHGTAAQSVVACGAPPGFVTTADDCDDADSGTHPGASELCDRRDNDCNGVIDDDALDTRQAYSDADGDGFAGSDAGLQCELTVNGSWTLDDCDDADPLVYPGAPELCDLVDNDCDAGLGFDAVVSVTASTIASAVERVPDGGVVCVPAGTWEAGLDLHDRTVTVVGAGPDQTTITAYTSPVSVTGGAFTLEDVTVGPVAAGASMSAANTDLTLRRVQVDGVQSIHSTPSAALLSADSATVVLEQVRVEDVSLAGLGDPPGALLAFTDSTVTLDGLTLDAVRVVERVDGLVALSGGCLSGRGLTVVDAVLGDGDALRRGYGGVVHTDGGATLELADTTVADVRIEGQWGGLFYLGTGAGSVALDGLDIERLIFIDGRGGIFTSRGPGDVDIDHLRLVESTAHQSRGWVYFLSGAGDATLRNVVSADNRAVRPVAGGWVATGNHQGTVRIENGTFLDAESGGYFGRFAYLDNAHIELVNVHLGAVYGEPTFALTYCDVSPCGATLDHVTAEFGEDALTIEAYWSPPALLELEAFSPSVTAPGFVSTTGDGRTWDLRLLSTSPLVDAGSAELDDPDGTRSDIGAYGGPGGDW